MGFANTIPDGARAPLFGVFEMPFRLLRNASLLAVMSALLTPLAANATILQGQSTGTFSNLTCTSCAASSLSSTSFTLGTTASGGSSSLLSIVSPFNFSVGSTTAGVELAELILNVGNKPGQGQTGVSFDYNLVLTFTTPGSGTSETFIDTLSGNGGSGANGSVQLSGLNLTLTDPFVLPGVTLSNFRFSPTSTSTFSNGVWTASNGGPYDLFLLADVTATSSAAAVPEPSTLTLLGAAFCGLFFLKRRKAV